MNDFQIPTGNGHNSHTSRARVAPELDTSEALVRHESDTSHTGVRHDLFTIRWLTRLNRFQGVE